MELSPDYNDKLGNRAIEIQKRINGIAVVATIERGENKEFIVTSWKYKKSDALDASNETPGLYVRNDSDIAKVKKILKISRFPLPMPQKSSTLTASRE